MTGACFGRAVRWMMWGGLILLVGCQVTVAPNAPGTISGTWVGTNPDRALYLLLTAEGEFRVADDPGLFYDAPLLMGRYQYDAGWLTLYNAGTIDAACRQGGRYAVVSYTPGDEPTMRLARGSDACDIRGRIFHEAGWRQPAADG